MQKAVLLHTTHYSNPLKGSRDLRKFVVTGPQEHKFIVKTVYYVIRYNNNNNNNSNNNNNNNSNNNDNINNNNNNDNKLPKAVTARVSKKVECSYLKKFVNKSSSWLSRLEITGEGAKTRIWCL